jgi:hypothetical protein
MTNVGEMKMAVSGSYLASRTRLNTQPFVRAYGQWVHEHIIPIVNDFENQARAVEQDTYDQLSAEVHWETYGGDDGDICERAFNTSLSFYETMVSLYQGTLNLFSAGLFHLIEQQLAALTHDGAIGVPARDTQLKNIVRYYIEHFNIDLQQFGSWVVIEEMRLTANAAKHGEGPSAEELRAVNPQLFQPPTLRFDNQYVVHLPLHLPLGGDGLYVTEADFVRYEQAANELLCFLIEQFENRANSYF